MNEMKLILNLRDGILTLNDKTLEALGRPRQVQMLLNNNTQTLVFRACSTKDAQAIVLPMERVISTDISGRVIIKKLCIQMNWADALTRECSGIHRPIYNAVSFDLSQARIIDMRR